MLRRLADDLWVAEQPLRFFGLELGTRMTVVRLAGGALWLHSPISMDDALCGELRDLGTPRFVVAPNRFHHLFVGEAVRAFPGVEVHVAPGLRKKRPDLVATAELEDAAPPAWSGAIDQCAFRGAPIFNEIAFHHRASRTLILSDLSIHVGPEAPFATRLLLRAVGAYGRFGPTLLEHVAIRDRRAARASLDRILAWDFDRVIVAHGRVLESGGREALREGYAWLR